ncbi:MAG: hypothetical protein BWY86_00953 [Candidatus Aminicenantes bacterium ADurb.Bin508]|nr:MAG: hypothetical protein BWY86_00953 [Candidatus Aminicenantes bacterium ADurb.Bin508]
MVDKNILRLALFEMMLQREVPPAVVIDEAIEISKVYGTESSPKFINGILDALAKREKLK